ncbi:MAG: TIGR02186 family protein [Candidatus Puniceispirillaceae bacterium]
MIRAVVLYILAICGMLAASLLPAHAGRVVADLSQSNVSITSGFHGTELLLFGAVDGRETDDIIVVVSGPPTDVAQRRKAQVGGIWINVETNIWKDAPSLYQILATRPLAEIANADILAQLQIGADQLQLQLEPEKPRPGTEKPHAGRFLQSFARNMASTGLWPADVGYVKLTDGALFRADVQLPANVISGIYDVRILQFRDGVVFSESETNIYIKKGGLSAMIYNFAHDYSLFYGLFAIAFAVAAGWLAAVAFRRG